VAVFSLVRKLIVLDLPSFLKQGLRDLYTFLDELEVYLTTEYLLHQTILQLFVGAE